MVSAKGDDRETHFWKVRGRWVGYTENAADARKMERLFGEPNPPRSKTAAREAWHFADLGDFSWSRKRASKSGGNAAGLAKAREAMKARKAEVSS